MEWNAKNVAENFEYLYGLYIHPAVNDDKDPNIIHIHYGVKVTEPRKVKTKPKGVTSEIYRRTERDFLNDIGKLKKPFSLAKDKDVFSHATLSRIRSGEGTRKKSTMYLLSVFFGIPEQWFSYPFNEFFSLTCGLYMPNRDFTETQKKYNDLTENLLKENDISLYFFQFLLHDTDFLKTRTHPDGEVYPYHYKDQSGKVHDCVFHASDFIYIKMLQDTITSQIEDKRKHSFTALDGKTTDILL